MITIILLQYCNNYIVSDEICTQYMKVLQNSYMKCVVWSSSMELEQSYFMICLPLFFLYFDRLLIYDNWYAMITELVTQQILTRKLLT